MTDLGQLSTFTIYSAMTCYLIAMVAFGIDISRLRDGGDADRPRKAVGVAMATTTLGVILHGIGVVLRGLAAGRVPWANMYEFSLVFTFVLVAIFLLLQRRIDLRVLGLFIVAPVLLFLGLAVAVFYQRADGVQPALDSYWLVIHVSTATVAIGLFAITAVLSIVQLVKHRAEDRAAASAVAEHVGAPATAGAQLSGATATGQVASPASTAPTSADRPSGPGEPEEPSPGSPAAPDGFLARLTAQLPSAVVLERLAYRINAVSFVLWTFTLIAGAIWAEHSWGRPWGWDPKETWSFIIWVVYAAYLHARATMGWGGRRAAYFSILGFSVVLVNYYIVNVFMPGLHSYAY